MPTEMPSETIAKTLMFSIAALTTVNAAIKDASNASRHRLLLAESEEGLVDGILPYYAFLTKRALSGHNSHITQLLTAYDLEWRKLFDSVRDLDQSLAPLVDTARFAQKAAHCRLAAILDCGRGNGQAEYAALTAALTSLSEAMGDNAQAAAKKSRKGKPHETFATPVPTAAIWSGVSEPTIRRYWRKPLKGIPQPPLNQTGSVEVRKRVLQDWGDKYRSAKAGAHEANAMNHPIPLASVGKIAKRKAGITD